VFGLDEVLECLVTLTRQLLTAASLKQFDICSVLESMPDSLGVLLFDACETAIAAAAAYRAISFAFDERISTTISYLFSADCRLIVPLYRVGTFNIRVTARMLFRWVTLVSQLLRGEREKRVSKLLN
jgi:hypothetical protein